MGFILAFLSVVLIYLWLVKPNLQGSARFNAFKEFNYAHRGLHQRKKAIPENSLLAFELAIKHHYGIELDVQITKDQQIVVFHDYNLLRVCGVAKDIVACDYAELQTYRLFDTDQKIPLLTDVLALVDKQVPLIIEIKQPGKDCLTTKLTAAILATYSGQYCIESFNPMALNWYRQHQPSIVRGQLATKFQPGDVEPLLGWALERLLLNFLSRPDFIAYEYPYLKRFTVLVQQKLFQAPLVVWTINKKAEFNLLFPTNSIIFENFII